MNEDKQQIKKEDVEAVPENVVGFISEDGVFASSLNIITTITQPFQL